MCKIKIFGRFLMHLLEEHVARGFVQLGVCVGTGEVYFGTVIFRFCFSPFDCF